MSICKKLCLFLAILTIGELDSTDQCPEPSSWGSINCNARNLTSVPRLVGATNRSYYLSLSDNPNLVITDDSFQNITLYSLDLNNNVNISISDHALKNQRNTLKELSISSSQLNKIPEVLKDLDKLQNINIASNKIQDWNVRVMKKLGVSLKKIDISNTGLTSWPIWLSDMSNLQWLDISHNPIGVIPHNAFSRFRLKLKYLDIGNTGISRMPGSLQTLQGLSELYISGSTVNDSSFYKNWLPSQPRKSILHTLDIRNTNITKLPLGLNRSNSISTLEIHRSKIKSIDGTALPAHLTHLTIYGSLLIRIGAGICSHSLVHLDLWDNNIERIEKEDLYDCVNLNFLDLEDNNIDYISPTAFARLTHLETLYLRDNRLNQIPIAIQKLHSLEGLYLDTNQLNCSCQDIWFPEWRRNTKTLEDLSGECTNLCIDLDEFDPNQNVINGSCEVHTECTEITPSVYTSITPSVYAENTSSAVLLNQITIIKYVPVYIVLILQSV